MNTPIFPSTPKGVGVIHILGHATVTKQAFTPSFFICATLLRLVNPLLLKQEQCNCTALAYNIRGCVMVKH